MSLSEEEIHHLLQIVHAEHLYIVHYGSLGGIGVGHYKSFIAQFASQNGHWQHAFHRQHSAVERQFAHNHVFRQLVGWDFLIRREYAYGYRQVVGRTFLFHVGRRHVYHHLGVGEVDATAFDGRFHTLSAFPHGCIWQPHDKDAQTLGKRGFDGH